MASPDHLILPITDDEAAQAVRSRRSPVYRLLEALAALARVTPRPVGLWWGRLLGGLGRVLVDWGVVPIWTSPGQRCYPRVNLRRAFPDLSRAQETRLIAEHFQGLGQMAFELLRAPLGVETVDLEGIDALRAALAQGRGAIIITLHLGNFLLAGAAVARHGRQVWAPVETRLGDPGSLWFAEQINRLGAGWLHTLPLRSHHRRLRATVLRQAVDILAKGQVLLILSDLHGAGPQVEFFGTQVHCAPGALFLAHKTGAPVFFMYSVRQSSGRHLVRLEPLAFSGDAQADAQLLYREFERVIRAHPAQWLWTLDRWNFRLPE